jgi:hypothetical protein
MTPWMWAVLFLALFTAAAAFYFGTLLQGTDPVSSPPLKHHRIYSAAFWVAILVAVFILALAFFRTVG